MTFGARLKQMREAAELSQTELATKAGVPVGTIRGYEQGRRLPLAPVLFRLANAVGVDCTAFAECDDVRGGESGRATT